MKVHIAGQDSNKKAAQQELLNRARANGQAALGKYVAGTVKGSAASQDLFVKNHAY